MTLRVVRSCGKIVERPSRNYSHKYIIIIKSIITHYWKFILLAGIQNLTGVIIIHAIYFV